MSEQLVSGLFERRPERDADYTIGDMRYHAWWYRGRGTMHYCIPGETFSPCLTEECKACAGSGECPLCDGSGEDVYIDEQGNEWPSDCRTCDGSGVCINCAGNGAHFRPTKRSAELKPVC